MRGPWRARIRQVRRRARFYLLRGVLELIARLPRRVGLALLGGLGGLVIPRIGRARRTILANLELVFPEWSAGERRRFLYRLGRNFGRSGLDFIRLSHTSLPGIERLVRVEGLEHLERARRPGVGVICLSAHLGCWELLPYRMRALGYEVAVVYRPLSDRLLDSYVAQRRRRFGIETHARDQDIRRLLRSLRRGALVGLLADQRTRVDSIRAPFLGHPAWTPIGPVLLALRTGAPIVPVVAQISADGTHRLRLGPEIPVRDPGPGASPDVVRACIEEATERCNDAIGRWILEAPDQWVWFHERWGET
ncbi:MAG: lysophospholipid acyltransferase family protein [Candidatus Eisenbacteria bacterium]